MSFTNAQKVMALKRELSYRNFVYPKRVRNGSMKKTEADMQLAIFKEMIADYERLVLTEQLPLGD